jgi:hypothetical protein
MMLPLTLLALRNLDLPVRVHGDAFSAASVHVILQAEL